MRGVGLAALLFHLLTVVKGYGKNAGLGACEDLIPGHTTPGSSPHPSQAFPSPFSVTANSASYAPNQQIQVSLRGICGRQFKGFLVQARAAEPTAASSATQGFGTFTTSGALAKSWCTGNFAATHTSSTPKDSIDVTWTAPSTAQGHIVFMVTFVESYDTFWVGQKSVIIRDSTDASTPTHNGVPSAVISSTNCPTEPVTSTQPTQPASGLTKPDGCGTTIGCFDDCNGNGCNNIVTWQNMANPARISFSLKGRIPGISSGYLALGFSDDNKMGNDGVTGCVYLNNQILVHNSRNDGRSNSKMASTLATNPSGSYTNGILECSFELPVQNDNELLNVQKERYLLLARRTSASGDFLQQHSEAPLVSSVMVDLQKASAISGSGSSNLLVKVHGSLMVVAWIFAASLGIVIARYFKPQWPDSKCCGEKVWFQMHRSFMILVFLAAVMAFIIIFVDVQGYSDLGQETSKKAHPILGIIVTALAVLNPIMALFRPHPGDANRPIFNWAHFGVGSLAHILAVVTVFLGVNLGKPAVPSYVTWILVGYVAWQVLIEFLLVFVRCKTEAKDRSESYEMAQKGQVGSSQSTPSSQSSPARQGLLLLHIIAITALTSAIIVCIAIA